MKNQTQESYDLSAEKYRNKFENYAPYRSSIEKFISLLPPNSRILDAGCGRASTPNGFSSIILK